MAIDIAAAATRKIGPLPAFAWGGIVGGGLLAYKLLRGDSGGASSQFGQVVGGGNIDYEGNPAGGGSGGGGIDDGIDIDPIGTLSCGPRPLLPTKAGYQMICVPGVGWQTIPIPGWVPPTGNADSGWRPVGDDGNGIIIGRRGGSARREGGFGITDRVSVESR